MASKALRVLTHIAPLRARLWRRDESGEHTLVAANRRLINISQTGGVVGRVTHWRHPHCLVEMSGSEATVAGSLRP